MIKKYSLDLKFRNQHGKGEALIADRGNPRVIADTALLAKILDERFFINSSVISDYKINSKSQKLYNEFGIKSFFYIHDLVTLRKKIFFLIKVFFYLIKVATLFFFKKLNFYSFINNFKYSGIKVGDIIYDTYIRYNNRYINPSFFSYNFIKIFLSTLYKIEIIFFILKKKKIKIIIGSSKAYYSVSNLLLRCSIALNIKAILISSQFIKFFKKKEDSLNYIWNTNYKKIKNRSKILVKKKINLFFYKRFFKNQQSGTFVPFKTLKKLYSNDNIKDFNFIYSLFGIANKKQTIFVNCLALHCFSDAPCSTGKFIFRDYYQQFIQTLEFLKNNNAKNFYWLIKIHPDSANYDEIGIVDNILKKFNLSFIKICPKNINNVTLFKNINNLYTGRSTIGLEYACFGKKPIICGEASYSQNNISINAKNLNEYFKLLISNKINNKLTKKEVLKAKSILYYLEKFSNSSIEKKSLLLPHREEKNNFQLFLKNIYYNMKYYNLKDLQLDPYYIALENKILNNLKF